jgi:hypothetical protein
MGNIWWRRAVHLRVDRNERERERERRGWWWWRGEERESEQGSRARCSPKDTYPVTYFLQLGYTSYFSSPPSNIVNSSRG